MRHTARIKKKPKLNTFMLHSKSTYFYKQRWNSYLVPAMCALALLLVMGLCISPLTPNSESAYADTATLDNASLKLTVGSTNLAKPDAKAGEVNYITTSVNVNAANVDGYKVYVQAAPGNSAVLRNGNTEITGVGDNIAVTNFENNKWGYALDSTGASVENLTYTSVPENSSVLNPAYTTNAVSEEKNFNLAFAAKFGTDATAGHYSTNVLLSAVASAKEVAIFDEPTGFNGIMNMQNMTSAVCSGAAEGTSGRLRDTRDMKVYWVTKLKDGNCWMTQNLDLDLYDDVNLTSADTDITGVWTPATTQKELNFQLTYGAVQSYDPGYYINTEPLTTSNCTEIKGCGVWLNVLNGIWNSSNDPSFTVAVDESAHMYNAHYMVGNYYSFGAATAGTQGGSSICPKGWQLPVRDDASVVVNKGFGYLLNQYSLIKIPSSGEYNIRQDPLYFLPVGYTNPSKSNILSDVNSVGNYQTGNSSGNFRYTMYFTNSQVVLAYLNSTANYNYVGQPIRCVAR